MGSLRLPSWGSASSATAAARGHFLLSPSCWHGRGRPSRCAPSSAAPPPSLGHLRVGTEQAWQWDCHGGDLGGGGGGRRDYAKEIEAAVRVVQVACTLCQRVQDSLLLVGPGGVHSKLDRSLVTVDELLLNNLELENSKDKIKEQKEKIKLNKWLPYLVGSMVELPVAVLTDMLLHKGFSLAPYMRLS